VQLAVLSQLRLPGCDNSAAHAAPAGATPAAQPGDSTKGPGTASTGTSTTLSKASSSASTKVPFAYSLQLFDTAGAKEVTWGAAYKLVADAAGGSDGRALLPSVQLQPGKYLVVLQLQPEACQQWVDPVTGATEPAPSWQLSLLPSADEKVRRQRVPSCALLVAATICCDTLQVPSLGLHYDGLYSSCALTVNPHSVDCLISTAS
jgi:hypothetical protein